MLNMFLGCQWMAETTGMMTMLVLSPLFQALHGKLELSYHDPEEKYSHPEFHIISAALTDTQISHDIFHRQYMPPC